jgi:hypothetical protein
MEVDSPSNARLVVGEVLGVIGAGAGVLLLCVALDCTTLKAKTATVIKLKTNRTAIPSQTPNHISSEIKGGK